MAPVPQRVFVVTFEGAQTLDVTGPAEVFATASRLSGRELYRVELASAGGGVRGTSCGMRVETRDLLRVRTRSGDVVVVAGGSDGPIRRATADAALRGWLVRAAPVVSALASVCSGAFVLAAAGLLDGLRAATHWSGCAILARTFPRVEVDPNAIFVRQGKVWTSAGVTTGIDMALAMGEEAHGRTLADAVAAQLVLYVRRPGFQSQFSDALVAQVEDGTGLARAIGWARAHLDRADVESMARHAGLSVRTFHRRCRETLGMTPARVIDRLRVEHARTLLDRRELPVKTLAVSAGFGTGARMNRAFARELGMSPRAYRALHGGH